MKKISPTARFVVAIALLLLGNHGASAEAPGTSTSANDTNAIVLNAKTSGANVVFTWRMLATYSELQQMAANANTTNSRWTPVPDSAYSTNGSDIVVTLPTPTSATLYQVRRWGFIHRPASFRKTIGSMPPPPAIPTNRPVFKRPSPPAPVQN